MRSHLIVESDNLTCPCLSILKGVDYFPIEPFFLQDAIDSFSNGIFPRITSFRHANLYTVALKQIYIDITAILSFPEKC